MLKTHHNYDNHNDYGYLPINKLVAVVEISDEFDAIPLCQALLSGGVTAIEVTLRTPQALAAINRIAAAGLPISLGVGTIINVDNLRAAQTAGGQFFVSPMSSLDLLESCTTFLGTEQHRLIPGVATVTEAMMAYTRGFKVLKFFPAEPSGGSAWLKSVAGPLPHIRFMPTGGIRESMLKEYAAMDTVAAIGGTWIASTADIHAKNWLAITNKAKLACRIINAF
jgi:2-dehydro-3-deoxyphosphogluconate aldolase/(4S)-4-hydroxy-2-oxoglutarate aldolase